MPARRGLLAPQNNFLETIATRFDGTHSNFVLGNAQVANVYPIVYCSDGFCELTGFPRAQIMQKGCACLFLIGPETQEEHIKQIENALDTKSELKLEVTFYKSSGTPFQCLLDIVPIKNEKHEVVLFLASHKELNKDSENNSSNDEDEEEDDDDLYSPVDEAKSVSNSQYQRRRSRAVLYQLSGHYRKSVTMKSKLKLNNNILHTTALPEYTAASLKKPKFILSHYGAFKTCFDWLILIATFYVAIVVPFSASFRDHQDKEPIRTIYVDVFVEIIFIIDIILSFRTTYVNKKGEVVTNTKSILTHYLRGWFIIDLLAALPFDVLYAAELYSRNTLIHLLKLTRLLRLVRLFAKMDRYSQYSYIILTLLMLGFSLLAHWLACLWYVIAVEEIELNPVDWDVSWLRQLSQRLGYDVTNETDVATAYITALYFTTSSLTSVGFGNVAANTNREKVFSVFIMLIGALMHAVVFGNVTAIIQRMYARRSQYQTKLRDLKDFFRLHQIPKRLKQRMTEYFQTTWSLNHGIDTNEVLCEFPDELRGDVSLHLHREILSLPIFETAPQGFLKLMSRSVKSNFCAPGEYLVHTGDALSYLYLVCNGSMEVLQNDMVVAILGKGDLVGCDIPFSLTTEAIIKSSSDVKALTYCDLKSIHVPSLLEVLKMYPEFAETFCTEIIHDLTFNLREGYQNEETVSVFPGIHSLTMPSISEDDEDDDENDDVDDDDEDDDTNRDDEGRDDDDDSGGGGAGAGANDSPSIGRSGGGGGGVVHSSAFTSSLLHGQSRHGTGSSGASKVTTATTVSSNTKSNGHRNDCRDDDTYETGSGSPPSSPSFHANESTSNGRGSHKVLMINGNNNNNNNQTCNSVGNHASSALSSIMHQTTSSSTSGYQLNKRRTTVDFTGLPGITSRPHHSALHNHTHRNTLGSTSSDATPLLGGSKSSVAGSGCGSTTASSSNRRRPAPIALKFANKSSLGSKYSSRGSKSSICSFDRDTNGVTMLKDELEQTRNLVDKLDHQINSIKSDVTKMGDDMKSSMYLLQQLCSHLNSTSFSSAATHSTSSNASSFCHCCCTHSTTCNMKSVNLPSSSVQSNLSNNSSVSRTETNQRMPAAVSTQQQQNNLTTGQCETNTLQGQSCIDRGYFQQQQQQQEPSQPLKSSSSSSSSKSIDMLTVVGVSNVDVTSQHQLNTICSGGNSSNGNNNSGMKCSNLTSNVIEASNFISSSSSCHSINAMTTNTKSMDTVASCINWCPISNEATSTMVDEVASTSQSVKYSQVSSRPLLSTTNIVSDTVKLSSHHAYDKDASLIKSLSGSSTSSSNDELTVTAVSLDNEDKQPQHAQQSARKRDLLQGSTGRMNKSSVAQCSINIEPDIQSQSKSSSSSIISSSGNSGNNNSRQQGATITSKVIQSNVQAPQLVLQVKAGHSLRFTPSVTSSSNQSSSSSSSASAISSSSVKTSESPTYTSIRSQFTSASPLLLSTTPMPASPVPSSSSHHAHQSSASESVIDNNTNRDRLMTASDRRSYLLRGHTYSSETSSSMYSSNTMSSSANNRTINTVEENIPSRLTSDESILSQPTSGNLLHPSVSSSTVDVSVASTCTTSSSTVSQVTRGVKDDIEPSSALSLITVDCSVDNIPLSHAVTLSRASETSVKSTSVASSTHHNRTVCTEASTLTTAVTQCISSTRVSSSGAGGDSNSSVAASSRVSSSMSPNE